MHLARLISNANVVMASGSVVICSPDAGNERAAA
jgi:hypothetical protein